MSLLEEIQSRRIHQQKLCAFGRWIQTANEADLNDIQAAFADLTLPSSWIADALKDRVPGKPLTSIREHRRGDCPSCPEELMNGKITSNVTPRQSAPSDNPASEQS